MAHNVVVLCIILTISCVYIVIFTVRLCKTNGLMVLQVKMFLRAFFYSQMGSLGIEN